MVGIEQKTKKRNLFLILTLFCWGMICALILVSPYLRTIGDGWIAKWRCERLEERYNDLLANGKFDIAHNSHVLGYGLYFPFIMKIFDITDGKLMYCYAQAICGIIAIFLYPYLIYKLYNSFIISIISPLLLHFSVGDMLYINKSGEYFSPIWVFVVGIPILLIILKSTVYKEIIVYSVGLFFVSMFANIMRGQSALPIILIWLCVIVYKTSKRFIKISYSGCLLLICMMTMNLLSTTIPDLVAKRWGVEGKIPYNSSPWHSILIGMGYIDNDYGLYYNDDAGRDIVAKYYPYVDYNSSEYYAKCKEIALKIIKENPLFFIKGLLLKTIESIRLNMTCFFGNAPVTKNSNRHIMLFLDALFLLVYILKKRSCTIFIQIKTEVLLIIILIFIGNYAGILAYPMYYYNWGSCGATGLLLLFVLFRLGAQIQYKFTTRNYKIT